MNIRWGNELHLLLGFLPGGLAVQIIRKMIIKVSVSPTDKNEDTDKKLFILLLLSCFQQHIRPCADHEVWLPGGAQACHRWCKHLLVCRP